MGAAGVEVSDGVGVGVTESLAVGLAWALDPGVLFTDAVTLGVGVGVGVGVEGGVSRCCRCWMQAVAFTRSVAIAISAAG